MLADWERVPGTAEAAEPAVPTDGEALPGTASCPTEALPAALSWDEDPSLEDGCRSTPRRAGGTGGSAAEEAPEHEADSGSERGAVARRLVEGGVG